MAVTQGVMIKSFVSAIDFLDQREIDPQLYDQSRDRAFTDIMKLVNTTTPSKRLSDVSKVIRVDRQWITTPSGKDVLQYFCKP